MVTKAQLAAIMPLAKTRIDKYIVYLNSAMSEFGIDTPVVMAHFLAQVAHESGELRYTKELASGDAYEGRKDLGNIKPGDGRKYKGRGFLQLTGRANYQRYKDYCGFDVIAKPQLLEEPKGASRSAAWVFVKGLGYDLRVFAKGDTGANEETVLKRITKVINGGYNGLDSRRKYLQRAKAALMKS